MRRTWAGGWLLLLMLGFCFSPITLVNEAQAAAKKKKKKVKKAAPPPADAPTQDTAKEGSKDESAAKDDAKDAGKDTGKDDSGDDGEEDDDKAKQSEFVAEEGPKLKQHRYAYVATGVFIAAAIAFAYSAQGEAKRAETIGSAREAENALAGARAAASTATVMYILAGTSLAYGLLMELVPEPIASKATLTFHF